MLDSIPNPPPAYWSNIPWWAYISALLLVLFALPIILAWKRGAIKSDDTNKAYQVQREQALLDRERRQYDNLTTELLQERTRSTDLVKSLQTAHDSIDQLNDEISERDRTVARWQQDSIVGWSKARTMSDLAHAIFHDLMNLRQMWIARKLPEMRWKEYNIPRLEAAPLTDASEFDDVRH